MAAADIARTGADRGIRLSLRRIRVGRSPRMALNLTARPYRDVLPGSADMRFPSRPGWMRAMMPMRARDG
jgi:hypothetical protein